LKARVLRLYNDRQPSREFKAAINWGNSVHHYLGNTRIINNVQGVSTAGNKLMTFTILDGVEGVTIPEFTNVHNTACEWSEAGIVVVCRTKLRGHSGDGIVLVPANGDIVPAPLYVKYVKKAKEFRVHVAFDEVIDVQEKRKRSGFEGADYQVRNHQTGWVYCREDIIEPEGIRDMAIRTVRALGLDFGAVDIIFNSKQNQCYVLEVNTAPGLEGETINKYTDAFIKELT
jgi:glutathione synthase/RimK-type ligase-like ATP-grasp enzyme